MTEPAADAPLLLAATIDCSDLETMTRFWGELLGVEFQTVEQFGFLAHAPDRKVTLWLQEVPEPKAGKNRLHLDFVAADMAASLEKVTALGGGVGDHHEWQGFVWTTCSDPEGNVFDIMQAQQPAE
ncbi:MAG: VOC family protein [Acidimicrobiia bacterium]|nr:VOC family protein [Acidimicrobiia bacterium]NNC75367.1 VOC family protein [Acidimicrobiia bacterium]